MQGDIALYHVRRRQGCLFGDEIDGSCRGSSSDQAGFRRHVSDRVQAVISRQPRRWSRLPVGANVGTTSALSTPFSFTILAFSIASRSLRISYFPQPRLLISQYFCFDLFNYTTREPYLAIHTHAVQNGQRVAD